MKRVSKKATPAASRLKAEEPLHDSDDNSSSDNGCVVLNGL